MSLSRIQLEDMAAEWIEPMMVDAATPVLMFTAPNPGPKTLDGTHSYVIGGDNAYVVDPGPAIAAYQEAMAKWLRRNRHHVRAILLTHGHPDHAPGARLLAELLEVPVEASPNMEPSAIKSAGVTDAYLLDERLPVDDDALAIIPSPGHSADHVALWLESARILFSGDTILGRGTSLVAPPEGDMAEYMQTLEHLRSLEPRVIAPGHGPLVTDPPTKFAEYVEHRRMREGQVIHALGTGPATISDLVSRLYADVDRQLHGLAAGSLEAQLLKLEREGVIERRGSQWELTEPRSL